MTELVQEAKSTAEQYERDAVSLSTKLEQQEYKFRQEGGDLYLLRADFEAERTRLEKELAAEKAALRELIAGPAPLLIISHLLNETEKQARSEAEARKSSVLVAALAERDNDVLSLLKRSKVPGKQLELIENLLQADRNDRAEHVATPMILNGGDHLATELRHLRSTILPEVKSAIKKRLETASTIQERLTRSELELGRVPTEDAIAAVQQELTRLRQKHQEKQAEHAAHEDKVRVLERQLEDAKRKFERELGLEVESQVDREHHGRVLKHSARVRETLAKFRVAVIRKHAHRLERLVLESFTHLLRKRALVTDLKIDPATFRIKLTGGNGKPLPFDRLSAGERQLLATALLWGLAKASGRPLPTIIDTPLGRLDSSHRRHLLDRYFPIASHQVILLSTDEEVDEASLARLKPHIGRSYTLEFDEKQHSSVIKPGYFWKHENSR